MLMLFSSIKLTDSDAASNRDNRKAQNISLIYTVFRQAPCLKSVTRKKCALSPNTKRSLGTAKTSFTTVNPNSPMSRLKANLEKNLVNWIKQVMDPVVKGVECNKLFFSIKIKASIAFLLVYLLSFLFMHFSTTVLEKMCNE